MIYTLIFNPILLCIFYLSMNAFKNETLLAAKNAKEEQITADLIKIINLLFTFANLLYACYLWKKYPIFSGDELFYPAEMWLSLHHNLNMPFIILTLFVSIIIILNVWHTRFDVSFFLFLLQLLQIFLVLAFSCNSIFVFLLFFELASLPVFVLIVQQGSLRRERVKASYYFLLFTAYGSIAILLFLVNFYNLTLWGSSKFFNDKGMWLLLFIAFAVKAPLAPFHTWLPFAHVEASTPISIILAAIMLKLGGYGVIKFLLPLFSAEVHMFFKPFAIFLCLVSVIYGAYCALRQIDLKRQIAFSSISHMGFALLGVFSFTEVGIKGSIYLMISHGLTSTALFFLIGVLSDRYHSRSILIFSGLFTIMPVFSFFLFFFSLANIGFPGTSGFLPEFLVLVSVLKSAPFILFFVLFGMFLVTSATLLVLLRILFGHVKHFFTNSSWVDVIYSEFFVLLILLFWVIYLGMVDFFKLNINFSTIYFTYLALN